MTALQSQAEIVLNCISDGVIILDAAGRITGLNPAAEKICELDPAESLDRSYGEVFFVLPENDEFNQVLLDLIGAQTEVTYDEVDFTTASETKKRLAVTASLLIDPESQERLGSAITLKDISQVHELRQARDKLAAELAEKHEELRKSYLDLESRNKNLHETQRRLFWLKLLAGALVLAAFGWWGVRPMLSGGGILPEAAAPGAIEAEAGGLRRARATSGDIRVTVSATGSIRPIKTMTISAAVGGRVEARPVSLGDKVGPGDLLVELDADEILPKVRQAEADLLKAKEAYDEIAGWAKRPELKQAERSLDMAQQHLTMEKRNFEESKRLFEEGVIPRNDLDQARITLRRAMFDLAEAEERLSLAKEKGAPDKLRVAGLILKNAELALQEAQEKLEKSKVRAPISGVVMQTRSTETGKSQRLPDVGARVNEGEALMALGALQPLGVDVEIDESQIGAIQPGQKALVTLDALDSGPLTGKVRSVAPQAESRGQSIVFPVLVELPVLSEENASEIRLGMTARVRIVTEEAIGAVLVPVVAVERRDGQPAVRIPGNGQPAWQPVETGLSDRDNVQILSGLEAGQTVLY